MINLLVKTRKTKPTNDGFLGCLAVAFTLLAMICVAASKSGACLNPAVGIAQTCYQMIQCGIHDETCNPNDQSTILYRYLWIYITAPFFGALLAGLANRGHLISYNKIATTENLTTRASKLLQ